MANVIKTVGTIYSIISIITIIILTPYLYNLTMLNIQDAKESKTTAFPWIFITLTDLLPILLILTNVKLWKEIKRNNVKQMIITMIAPIIYIIIITAYFLYLIIG